MQHVPRLNSSVHYVSHGTPKLADGSQEFASRCVAADVTEIDQVDPKRVGLVAKNPTGLFWRPLVAGGCTYDPLPPRSKIVHGERAEHLPGTWHFPYECVDEV